MLALGLQPISTGVVKVRGHSWDTQRVHPRVTPHPVVIFKGFVLPLKLKHKPVQRQRPLLCLSSSSHNVATGLANTPCPATDQDGRIHSSPKDSAMRSSAVLEGRK